MAGSVNKVILVGNLGNDPEVRTLNDGSPVVNLSIATSESWRDKATNERRERTEWHRVVMFNRLAEIAAEYLRKGSKVYIEGRLQTRKWQDQNGKDRWSTEIVANEMQMLDSRGGSGGDRQPQDDWGNGSRASRGSQPGAELLVPSHDHPRDFDDDIPF